MKARLCGNTRGSATLEILIAFTILALALGAAILMSFSNQTIVIDSETNVEAITKAQAQLEKVRADAREDFNLVNPTSSTETSGALTYTKNVAVEPVGIFSKKVTSTVTWQSAGRTLSVALSTLLTNPQSVVGGGTCSSVLSGDWKNPVMTYYEFGKDLLGDPSSGFPIGGIDVFNKKLYVVVNNSNGNNFPNLFQFDISSPSNPVLIPPGIDTDTSVKTGLNGIAVAGNYAYVAKGLGPMSSGQLQVIDISVNPMVVKKTYKVPGVTGTGGQGVGKTIFYYDGYVYLGLTKTNSGPEFNIIDVSNPLNPTKVGGYTVANDLNAIFVKDHYAYLASPNAENLIILDIANPANPVRVGGSSGLTTGGNHGKSIYAVGHTLYLGRTYGSREFYIFNAANPAAISTVADKDTGSGNETSINGLFIRDYLAFFLTDEQFQIWNIANPSNIIPWTQNMNPSEFLELPAGGGTALDCESNYVYVSLVPSNNKGYIAAITSSP